MQPDGHTRIYTTLTDATRAKAVDTPRRELLGTTPTDREHLLDLLYEQLAGA